MSENFKSLKGQFLLDSGRLRGSWFHRAVVLICQHDSEGALGLMLNRDTGNKFEDAITEDLPECVTDLDVFLGGPVQPGAFTYLHSDDFLLNANVLPNLNMGHSLDSLREIGESFSTTQKIRVFAGYAGWSPGQLESELERKAWIVHPATIDLVFDHDPNTLWSNILRQKGWKYKLLADGPDNPSLN